MSFQEQVEADLATVINTGEATVSIVYTPKDGEAKTINAIAMPEEIIIDTNEQGEMRIHHQAFVILTDATLGIESPRPDDMIAYGGLDRRVAEINSKTFGKIRVSTIAPETTAKQGETHRKRAT